MGLEGVYFINNVFILYMEDGIGGLVWVAWLGVWLS
jgi:hypothetical protein